MKILLFIVLFSSGIHFIPDAWVASFVKAHIPIRGDGENAMDSFEMHIIVIKTTLCAVGSYLLMKLLFWLKNRKKR
ncbi:hypothetical protein Y71_07750 [Kosakonia radicincitans DSM 16656]|uniref:Uncharacterized protein n=1 Tax=Kosakonia radicincitans TaxID=283686 RepID=A0AAX2EWY1_9ENTR|nr:hypothetical protein [Kosakonia radicincitans]MDP9568646.1 hypothetical protein [Kosakonia oryzae]ARD59812.1 hypothetical protein Y71_07750 [Kosakonia radicincitans DSM 16656]KDE34514.1 hypothetical protein AW40_21665 [Kosakonia radicincitans UMEnt01/12]MDD7995066.1 hypothetical protein [Kosakonia radicincitans]QEM90598.1 hypothetical protein FEI17_08060 [Kosakonia radicincitans]